MADNVHVEDVTKQLKEKFGKESPLTTTWGNVLEYLGMTLDYTRNGKVKILMYEYIEKMLSELPLQDICAKQTHSYKIIMSSPFVKLIF